MLTSTIILLVDVEAELARRIAAALRNAGHRPLQAHGIAETVRVVEQLGDTLGLLITAEASSTRTVLARIAPCARVLNIAEAGLDITRLPDEGWVQLVREVLEEPPR